MPYELIIFASPDPPSELLIPDSGIVITGHPAVHSSGRPGFGFTIPDGTSNSNGCKIKLAPPPGKVAIEQRAILFLRTADWEHKYPWGPGQTAAIAVDDFIFQDAPVAPTPIPPTPIPPDPGSMTPYEIITLVYRNGNYDLATKEGCGTFTEACCTALHEVHGVSWGHIMKTLSQNHWPPTPYVPGGKVHAVDAVMLLIDTKGIIPGGYDLVLASESPEAKPAFNRVGGPDSTLWYYPAK